MFFITFSLVNKFVSPSRAGGDFLYAKIAFFALKSAFLWVFIQKSQILTENFSVFICMSEIFCTFVVDGCEGFEKGI